jgi:hypothetical protein
MPNVVVGIQRDKMSYFWVKSVACLLKYLWDNNMFFISSVLSVWNRHIIDYLMWHCLSNVYIRVRNLGLKILNILNSLFNGIRMQSYNIWNNMCCPMHVVGVFLWGRGVNGFLHVTFRNLFFLQSHLKYLTLNNKSNDLDWSFPLMFSDFL